MDQFEIREFRPLRLTLDHIGPFQSRVEEIDFTNENNEPCNLFLLLSQNGRGKTTVLEVMTALMGMLESFAVRDNRSLRDITARTLFNHEQLDNGFGVGQLDLLVRYVHNAKPGAAVLTLFSGRQKALRYWTAQDLAAVAATEGVLFNGFEYNVFFDDKGLGSLSSPDTPWFAMFLGMIANECRQKVDTPGEARWSLPTLLYFSAYRNVVPIAADQQRTISAPRDWNYRPAQTFGAAGADWRDSLDNLLVWLKWLDNGRFEEVVKLVNDYVFEGTDTAIKGIRRDPPEAEVIRAGNIHRLDALSSGEKSLVQLFMRIGAHRTRNTILLIDEPEVHLHEKWKYRLFYQLKKLVQASYPGLTIIVATHSQEMMKALALEMNEPKLVKGGYLFETAKEEARAEQIRQEALVTYGDI